jgi:ubiquinone/menaquinone biosynthesis C-methylase UbiE
MQYANLTTKSILAFINQIEVANSGEIGHNDHLFLRRIFSEGLIKYENRLKAIGFTGKHKVLDAGCGYGQWSLALARLNDTVETCDISTLRVRFLLSLADQLGFTNLHAQVCGIDEMPYPDNYFDAVFCYGVIFLTPWRKSLVELARVLKPGGRIYVNANGLGWYMFLWQEEHNKADDYDPRAIAARCFGDTLIYEREGLYRPGMNLIIEQDAITQNLEDLGFTQILVAHEGCLHVDMSMPVPRPFFKGQYNENAAVYEVTAILNHVQI